jgi:hypothetical protein
MAKISRPKKNLTRKQFLQLSAAGAAGLLAGCQASPAGPASTTIAAQGKKTAAVATNATSSRVVRTSGKGVWDGDSLSPAVLRRMLDASITKMTGLDDARAAWASLFSPDDKIAIKVNTFRNSLIWTHVPLVTAVTDSLQDSGVPAEQITITDYYTSELETAGFAVNRDGAGIRCYGADDKYEEKVNVGDATVRLNPVLVECTALINMPVLKSHMITGITFAMKNHYGSVNIPSLLHSAPWDKMAALNALPQIKDRTRLVLGDVLEANLQYENSFPYWQADYRGDSILMSFDPVAHDTVGLDMLTGLLAEKGVTHMPNLDSAQSCLESGAGLGIGTNLAENIEITELAV